jgi:hypothetical protein
MGDDRKLKGTYIRAAAAFLNDNYEEEQRRAMLAALAPRTRDVLGSVSPSDWYPLEIGVDVLRQIERAHEGDAETRKVIRRAGRAIARDATGTFMKLLLKVLTPRMFASKFPEFWRRYHDFGDCKIDVSRIEERWFAVEVPGYEYLHSVGAGWIEHVFDSLGKTNIVVKDNCPPGEILVPTVRWETTWT